MVKISKLMPFLVLLLGGVMFSIDTFTQFEVSPQMIIFAEIILTPLGLGGLAKYGFDKRTEIAKIIKPETIEAVRKLIDDLKK